ncbi:unnamed protein product [Brugia pahangi]|uniref:Zf-NOSIP domain-containing protein n=1 Tax=Brugia pahangi TaxID=6280 RepID=A0A0N4U018_BRUPA|nr:unnamed protein product [Brugia pahangi]
MSHEDILLTRLAAYEERNAQQNMEEGPAPQQPEFNIEEAEWAPLPDSYDAEEQWLAEAELAPLPDDSEESPEVPMALLSRWRIHASKKHKQDGFCARCGHHLLLPPEFTAAQRTAAVELHALDWCPRACTAVMDERQVKRRRLNLVGREEDAQYLFVPGEKSHGVKPVIPFGTPHAASLSLPIPMLHPLSNEGGQAG